MAGDNSPGLIGNRPEQECHCAENIRRIHAMDHKQILMRNDRSHSLSRLEGYERGLRVYRTIGGSRHHGNGANVFALAVSLVSWCLLFPAPSERTRKPAYRIF